MPQEVFISYSTKDQSHKDALCAFLNTHHIPYFLDANDLAIGKDITESLKSALRKAKCTLMLVSDNSLRSSWVGMEAMFRLSQEYVSDETSLICIITDDKVFDPRYPIELQKHFAEKRAEMEALRTEMLAIGGNTEVYDLEIKRLAQVNVSDLMTKVRNHLGVVWSDPARKAKDLEKLLGVLESGMSLGPSAALGRTVRGSEEAKRGNTYNLANIHALLDNALSAMELETLCVIHFPKVANDFASGQANGQRILWLLDFAKRHAQFAQLLDVVKDLNPAAYAQYQPYS
jgi:hypothetical protein